MKVLFIEPYPTEGASSRYRVEQYIPFLQQHGIECMVRPFVSAAFYRVLYKKGYFLRKAVYFAQSCLGRLGDLLRVLRSDIIFIHLEAFPLGPPWFERLVAALGKKIIYDLDDAIYMRHASPAHRFIKFLKNPSKVHLLVKISRHVITCNAYLADYARKFNQGVSIIPTSVDTDQFKPISRNNNNCQVIGWIGSHSTAVYLNCLEGVFQRLAKTHHFIVKIIGADGYSFHIDGLQVIQEPWRLCDEISQFQSLDIGVYPLPHTEWILGKTGFKTIQYMSVGIPCVVSDVGANRDIVTDSINGFLASTEEEWVTKLTRLLDDASLRQKMGENGRKTVLEKFSLNLQVPKYLEIFKKVNQPNA